MKEVMLDTDMISYYFKGNQSVVKKVDEYLETFPQIKLSIISYYEVVSGLKFKGASKQLQIFEAFCSENEILGLSVDCAEIAGDIYEKTRKLGKAIDDIDILIAAIAIRNELSLITNNTKHFENIDDLVLGNWTE